MKTGGRSLGPNVEVELNNIPGKEDEYIISFGGRKVYCAVVLNEPDIYLLIDFLKEMVGP
jgi:hypothetical protein